MVYYLDPFSGGAAVECLLDALTKIFFPVDKE